ncbi:hypothetical protein NWE53_12700 [Bosea sp. NBC_00550]|nr:hypothetical protein [Bosea sp. NBC_00550]UZF94955.1 hypothetical protein NWE53_12700 [Bosea sp. NBC_00550]
MMFELNLGLGLGTDLNCEGTAGAEAAAEGDIGGIGRLALEDEVLCHTRSADARRCRQKRTRIRVARAVEDVSRPADLDDAAEIHHDDEVADRPHNGEVVADEEIDEVELA